MPVNPFKANSDQLYTPPWKSEKGDGLKQQQKEFICEEFLGIVNKIVKCW